MFRSIIDYFNKHPKEVGMTYMQHAVFSLSLGWFMAMGSVKAVIHAVNPNWCIDSSTILSFYLQKILDDNRHD